MPFKKKVDREKEFVDTILTKGGVVWWRCMADGRHGYYKVKVKNGEFIYWKNFSDESLKRLGM